MVVVGGRELADGQGECGEGGEGMGVEEEEGGAR